MKPGRAPWAWGERRSPYRRHRAAGKTEQRPQQELRHAVGAAQFGHPGVGFGGPTTLGVAFQGVVQQARLFVRELRLARRFLLELASTCSPIQRSRQGLASAQRPAGRARG